jgi:hypothetical protein
MSRGGNTTEESVKIQSTKVLNWKHRIAPFVTPWIIMVAVFFVALITHQFFSGPVALFFMALWVIGLTITTWHTWARRHEHARLAATAFTGGMSLWLLLATAAGPVWTPMVYMYVLVGSYLALTWNIRYAGITPSNKHDKVKTGPVDAISEIKGLKHTVTGKAKTIMDNAGKRVEVILNHPNGKNTTSDVKRRVENVAGLYGVNTSNIHVAESGTQGSAQTKVTVRMDNPTTDVTPYPGLSLPGKSITAGPLRTGVRSDGKDSYHWITGSDEESRAASATIYTGMTGSGKTRAYILAMLEQISRSDCAIPVIADPEKFFLSFGMISDYLPCAADSPEQTDQLVRNLPEAMRYRAALLGTHGYYDGWVPECWTKHRIPVQPVHIEEAGGYLTSGNDFYKALTLCRALGMPVSISLQVAKHTQLPTEARGQFGNSLAFGVKKIAEAAFALTAETINAGGDPSKWANNHPGRNVAEVTGVPSDQWSLTHRAFKITTQEIIDTFDECRSQHSGIAVCDPGTFELLSKGIVRPQRMIVSVPGWTPPEPPEPDDSPDPWTDITSSEAPTLTMVPDIDEQAPEEGPEDERPPVNVARDLIDAVIDDAEANGQMEITTDDFKDVMTLLGRHRTWVCIPLRQRAQVGRLERIPGKKPRELRYRILPREDRKEL